MPVGPAFKNKPLTGPASPAFGSDGTDAVFARFAALVRGSTELHGATVLAWDDATVSQTPPDGSGTPWVRLTPSPGPSKIYARTPAGICHRMPVSIQIETSVSSAEVLQSQRLWGAILRAIFPGKILDAQLQYLGVSRVEIVQPSWGVPRMGADGQTGIRCEGTGKVEFLMHFTTPE